MRRRTFIKTAGLGATAITIGWRGTQLHAAGLQPAQDIKLLPAGNAPAPVSFPHFPSRLHAFVWRNWQLVPADRLARAVDAKRLDIERLAAAMGLGPQPRITREQQRRSYI